MTVIWRGIAIGLPINIAIGMIYLTGCKSSSESLSAALLFGTTGVALTLIVGKAVGQERAVDGALVFARLCRLSTSMFP